MSKPGRREVTLSPEKTQISLGTAAIIFSFLCGAASWVATMSWFTYKNNEEISNQAKKYEQLVQAITRIEQNVVEMRTILEFYRKDKDHGRSSGENDSVTLFGLQSETSKSL